MGNLHLVLGGASSGKSAYAEKLALASQHSPLYLATAQVRDGEMSEKILKHQARREDTWGLIETPLDLVTPIGAAMSGQIILLDCLTLWLSNLMEQPLDVEQETSRVLSAIKATEAEIIAVSNETGMGLVPETALGRRFRDAQGQLNQRFAKAAAEVTFVAAGLPLSLKASS